MEINFVGCSTVGGCSHYRRILRSLFGADGAFLSYLPEDHARRQLAAVYPLLWHAIHAPWDEFQEDRRRDPRFRDLTEGEAAWWLHTQIKRKAALLVDDCPELELRSTPLSDQQFYLDLRGEIVLVFKKLIRRYSTKLCRDVLLRSNYPTPGNCDFWEQRQSVGIDAHRLVVGYEPIQELTEVRLFIGYPRTRGRRFTWIYRIPDQLGAAKGFERQPSMPDTDEERRKGFTVEPRRHDSEERGAV